MYEHIAAKFIVEISSSPLETKQMMCITKLHSLHNMKLFLFCFVLFVIIVCSMFMSHFQSRLYTGAMNEEKNCSRHFKWWKSTQLDCWTVAPCGVVNTLTGQIDDINMKGILRLNWINNIHWRFNDLKWPKRRECGERDDNDEMQTIQS